MFNYKLHAIDSLGEAMLKHVSVAWQLKVLKIVMLFCFVPSDRHHWRTHIGMSHAIFNNKTPNTQNIDHNVGKSNTKNSLSTFNCRLERANACED